MLYAIAIAAMVCNQHKLFFYSWTDEQIHFYVARRVAEGAVLYRDIDSSRPPLVIFPLAWLIKVGCSPLLGGRVLVLGSQIGTAAVLLWGGWRLASLRAGALAGLLFLSSPEVFDRIHYTGIQLVALTTTACVLFSLRRQPFRSGLLFGITLATDQHGLLICSIVALAVVVRRPREIGRFAAGAVVVPAIVFGGTWAAGGRHMWRSLVGHHLYHFSTGQNGNGTLWEKFVPWLYEHVHLVLGAALAFVFHGWRRRATSKAGPPDQMSHRVRFLCLVLGAHVAVVVSMTDAIFLHIVVIAPLLALLAGIGFDSAVRRWSERRPLSPALYRRAMVEAAGILGLVAAGWAAAQSYRERLNEQRYSFWPYILHAQQAEAERLDVSRRIAAGLALPRTDTIFGDPTIVSAVALDSRLRVSGDLADLDSRWLEAGSVSHQDVIDRIERDHVAAIVTPPEWVTQSPELMAYVMTCYQLPKVFSPPESGPGSRVLEIYVYLHKPTGSSCGIHQGAGG